MMQFEGADQMDWLMRSFDQTRDLASGVAT
jgi:hypothetical protein